jgi:hypothetical protein
LTPPDTRPHLRCSSMILGVALMMCWPFQYLSRLSEVSADTMSGSRIDVCALMSFTLMLPAV